MPGLWNRVALRRRQLTTLLLAPRILLRVCLLSNTAWRVHPSKRVLKRNITYLLNWKYNQINAPAILMTRMISFCLQCGWVTTYLVRSIAFPNKCWLPFRALGFLVGDVIPCHHPTHLPVQIPKLKKGSLCCGFAFCPHMFVTSTSVVKATMGCFGRPAYLKTQRQDLRGCPGDFVFQIFRSGIALLTGLWVSH